jgi:hypothetical protein
MKISFCTLFVALSLVSGSPVKAQIGQKVKMEQQSGMAGHWRNSSMGFNMDLILGANGKGEFDGETISWVYAGSTLTLTEGQVKNTYQAKLQGNALTLSGGDLDGAITFNRVGAEPTGVPAKPETPAPPKAATGLAALAGTWTAQNEEITFLADGKMIYNGTPLSCTVQGDLILVQAPAGTIKFQYSISGNHLTLKSDNLNAMYVRKTGGTGAGTAAKGTAPQAAGGVIDASLVGKWSYVGTANNLSGTFSNEEYITLNADGTYEYYSETSGTASGTNMYGNQTYAGGMASQSADRGTWRVNGNTIIANSQKTGTKVYQLQKRNHPKTGDPMIVLDGTAYVTYYQKEPWR